MGHISENGFGKDFKTNTNDKYGPNAELSQIKKILVMISFVAVEKADFVRAIPLLITSVFYPQLM